MAHWIPLAIGGAVLVLLVYLFLGSWVGGQVERFNQWRFDKAVAAKQAEIQKLQDENKKLIDEMKRAFALGEAKELERDAAYAELAKYGAAAREAVERQKEAAKEYEAEKIRIGIDVPLYQRCLDLCTERAEVGYPCKPTNLIYCQQYSGR